MNDKNDILIDKTNIFEDVVFLSTGNNLIVIERRYNSLFRDSQTIAAIGCIYTLGISFTCFLSFSLAFQIIALMTLAAVSLLIILGGLSKANTLPKNIIGRIVFDKDKKL